MSLSVLPASLRTSALLIHSAAEPCRSSCIAWAAALAQQWGGESRQNTISFAQVKDITQVRHMMDVRMLEVL
ncbi:hypothetical protein K503DRAFT_775795 [Rhizopogon vinicolor AM-OR11-026]|uniref:Uncharacterized protein n=1 Tax=Rhizopogon vinicolor AM-OR11-026 TaxID=1314800 RepID=A0A1B7MKY9_9AGAM|nr:hypothetical protein K503DRAFT_775795 [Rhizopogon vinicolor AM-OR11-026]